MLRSHHMNELLRGTALAALLILPTMAQTLPRAAAAESHGDWVNVPTRNFNTHALHFDDVVATLTVTVANGPMTLQMSGLKQRVGEVRVRQQGDTLYVEGPSHRDVWNWNDWFNFSRPDQTSPQNLQLKLTVPAGTPVRVDGLVGDAHIGDTMGPMNFEAVSSHSRIGHVRDAKLSLAGSGDIEVAEVSGPLSLEVAGSGKIGVGRTGAVKADLAGAGDVALGDIQGGLKLDIAGSGNLSAASVHGPVKVDIAGSGSVRIANGEANPLKIDIMGSGNFDFGGHAVDPRLSAMGSGQVRLKSYSGNLRSSGSVNLRVNGQSIKINGDDDDD